MVGTIGAIGEEELLVYQLIDLGYATRIAVGP